MNRFRRLLSSLFLLAALPGIDAGAQEKMPAKISWKKIVLDRNFRSEGVGVADVNKDGKLDVIVGDCWYEAPKDPAGEWKRHILRNADGKPADRKFDLGVYSKSFCCFTDDFNGDGWPDVIVIPFPGEPCYWYENPGEKGGIWNEHLLTTSACNETPIYIDLFKTGKKTLVMGWNPQKDDSDIKKGNHDNRGEMCYFVPGKDPTKPWTRVSISGSPVPGKTAPGTARFSHGLGHGDLNGDGRIDIIVPEGWWEQPARMEEGKSWLFHPAKGKITDPCADMYTYDMEGNGKPGIISTSAHNYGFWWSQQRAPNTFVQTPLFLPPSEVAKLPKDLNLNDEQKALLAMINKIRVDDEKRAPLAVDAELTAGAQGRAGFRASGLKGKVAPLGHGYPGKIIRTVEKVLDKPEDLKQFAQDLTKDDKGNPLPPGVELGIGAGVTKKGSTVYAIVVGDRGRFSLPSQTHALQMVDIDGDGLKDFVTGRRWWAHGPRGDAGPNDPAYLYWFQAKRGKDGLVSFTPHLIDDDSGIGTSFAIADMNGDGLPDVIVANKKGVHVFLQQR